MGSGNATRAKSLSAAHWRGCLQPSKNQVVWAPRRVPRWQASLIRRLERPTLAPIQFWSINKKLEGLAPKIERKLAGPLGRDLAARIAADAAKLTNFMSRIAEDPRPFVSLRTVDGRYFTPGKKSVSRDWHVDSAALTLTCTYAGKGTEWCDATDKTRQKFRKRKIISGSIPTKRGSGHRMAPFEVSILKGELREREDPNSREFLLNFIGEGEFVNFNLGNGLLHRGPGFRPGDSRRLVLTVSTMRVPPWLR
jgi:hypothetical protein